MNYTIVNGELYHFGVKGMRWGHRKARVDGGIGNRQPGRNKNQTNTTDEERKAKTRKMLKRGAMVAAGLVAAMGAYKAAHYVTKDHYTTTYMNFSKNDSRMRPVEEFIRKNSLGDLLGRNINW